MSTEFETRVRRGKTTAESTAGSFATKTNVETGATLASEVPLCGCGAPAEYMSEAGTLLCGVCAAHENGEPEPEPASSGSGSRHETVCDHCGAAITFEKRLINPDSPSTELAGLDGAGSDYLANWCGACGPKHRPGCVAPEPENGLDHGADVERDDDVRVETIAGTSRLTDMVKRYSLRDVPTKPPVIDMTDTPAEVLCKWRNYVIANSDFDLDAYAAERGWVPIDPADEARIRNDLRTRLPKSAVGFDARDGFETTSDRRNPEHADFVFATTAPKADEQSWTHRRSRERYGLIKPAVKYANANVIEDVDAFMTETYGVEADHNVLTDMLRDRAHPVRMSVLLADQFEDRPIDGVGFQPGNMVTFKGNKMVPATVPGRAEWEAKRLALCGDHDRLAAFLGIPNDPDAPVPNAWVEERHATRNGVPIVLPAAEFSADPSTAQGARALSFHKGARPMTFGEFTKKADAYYRSKMTEVGVVGFAMDRMALADDAYLEAKNRHRAHSHSATVFEDKKYIPDTHREAASRSVFANGGATQVEIDERVDLDDLTKIEKEWSALAKVVPQGTRPPKRMAFRLTGRHKAAGVYAPGLEAIAVDPRHPSSAWHEIVHHLDHTAEGGQASMSDEFRPILRKAQQAIKANEGAFAMLGKDVDYWRTPTEIHSRLAEMLLARKGVVTSLNGDASKHSNIAYTSLEPLLEEFDGYFTRVFGQIAEPQ